MAHTYYETLQISREATADEIKEAYRRLAWQSQSAESQQGLKEVNAAYAVLSSPERRAEYDAALADGTSPLLDDSPRAAASTGSSPAIETQAQGAEGPGFHLFYRLLGLPFGFSHTLSRLRYSHIPVNLLIGVVALYGIFASAGAYRAAPADQVMHTLNIGQVVAGTPYNYVTVNGRLVRDYGYTSTKSGTTTKFMALIQGKDVVFVTGDNLPDSGSYTGMLTPFSDKMRSMVLEDAKDPNLPEGIRFATQKYLDTTAQPTPPSTYLFLLIASVVLTYVALIPLLFGYILFRPERSSSPGAAKQKPNWPVLVEAHGRFRSEENGKQHTEHFVTASLFRTENPDQPLAVRYVSAAKNSLVTVHALSIPANSDVEWGYIYHGLKPQPALSFRFGGRKVRFSVPTEAHARWIAEAFTDGSLLS